MTPEFLAYAVGTARAPRAFAHPTTLKTLAEKTYPRGFRQAYIPHVRFD